MKKATATDSETKLLEKEIESLESVNSVKLAQLERAQQNLSDIQRSIQELNQETSKLKSTRSQTLKDQKLANLVGKDRGHKEVSQKLRTKLKELSENHKPLIPTKQKSILEIKENFSGVLYVHTVKLLYMRYLKDGDPYRLKTHKPMELALRILPTTTVLDLKVKACKYWELDPNAYSLRSDNFAVVDHLSEPVEQIIRTQKLKPCFWLIQTNNQAEKAFTAQDDYFVEESYKNQFSKQELRNKKRGLGEESKQKNYEYFLKSFKGLEHYLPKKAKVDEAGEAKRLESKQLSCPMLSLVTFMFVLTLLIHTGMLNFQESYWVNEQVKEYLEKEISYQTSYQEINSIDQVLSFVKDVVGPAYFNSETQSEEPLTYYYLPVGPLRIRTVYTKETDCSDDYFEFEFITCHEENYTEDTRLEETISSEPWGVFKTSEETNINSVFRGEFSSYDGSGYVRDFQLDEFTAESFSGEITQMASQGLVKKSIRAMFITFTLYSQNLNYWVWNQVVIENSISGKIRGMPLQPQVLKPNISEFPETVVYGLVRFLVAFCLLVMRFVSALSKDEEGKRQWGKLLKFLSFIDFTVLTLSVLTLGFLLELRVDEEEVIKSQEFYDFHNTALFFKSALVANSWALLLITFRLIKSLTLNRRIYLLTKNIEIACKNLAMYMLLLLPFIIGFCFLALTIWGPYFVYYRTFWHSVIKNILFSVGVNNTAVLARINLFWSVVFHVVYLVFVVFFILGAFIGIYIDSYREMRALEGYEDENKVWGAKDYLVWVLGFLSKKKVKAKIETYLQKRKKKKADNQKQEILEEEKQETPS